MQLQVMRIVEDTTVDGPGWRSSIYAAGCRHACPGCHNPETWSFEAGQTMTVDEVLDTLRHTEGDVTFSGGDPMYQAVGFTELARRVHEELGRNVWCFTGFRYEEVLADPQMRQMLPWLEVLVDGPYVQAERDLNLMFRGSRNQRLVDVPKSLAAGHYVGYEYDPYPKF